MTNENVVSPAESKKIQQATLKASSFNKLSISMGPIDTQFNMVEPIIAALGWDLSNPEEVHRMPSDTLTLMLQASGSDPITFMTLKQGGSIARTQTKEKALREASSRGASWTVISNGTEWWLYHKSDSTSPFKKIDIASDEATPLLGYLSRQSIIDGSLDNYREAENVDGAVQTAIDQALRSDAFTTLVYKTLPGGKGKLDRGLVAQAVNRLMKLSQEPIPPEAAGPAKAKPAPKPKAETTKPKSAKEKPPAKKKPSTPAAPNWVDGATHKMKRKKNVAFMRASDDSEAVMILPESLIALKPGKTAPKSILAYRDQAQKDGALRKSGELLKVTKEIVIDNAKNAAGFVAGTIVPDVSCWVSQDGEKLQEASSKAPSKAEEAG